MLGSYDLAPGQNHRIALSDRVDAAPVPPPDPNAGGGAVTVIENTDPSVTRIGSWNPWGWGAVEYAFLGWGNNRMQWPAPASPGYYTVYSKWDSGPNGVNNAPYIIHHGGGTTTVRVNQTVKTGPANPWVRIGGVFHLDPAAGHKVELSNAATSSSFQYVLADAVRYVRQPDPPANAVIVDDAEATLLGNWVYDPWNGGGDLWGGSAGHHHAPGAGSDTAIWTPALAASGRYRVYARWSAHFQRAADARYTVNHLNGASIVTVDQQADGGRWNLLGTFEMAPGSGHNVVLTENANGYVIADAVMFVPDTTSRVVAADAIRLVANTAEDPFFVHADHLGTPRRMTDTARTLVWDHVTRPFGETVSLLGVFENNRRFPGQYFDSETELHYNYFRDYDPALGRYAQSDPIGLDGGLNTYGYAEGTPLKYSDKYGLDIHNCSRPVNGFPFVGNHSYLWDDSTNSACGMTGSSWKLGTSSPNEFGPSIDSCNAVPGSAGKEKEIMDSCRDNALNGLWVGYLNDCHNAADDAITGSGLVNPGAPGGRWGLDDEIDQSIADGFADIYVNSQ